MAERQDTRMQGGRIPRHYSGKVGVGATRRRLLKASLTGADGNDTDDTSQRTRCWKKRQIPCQGRKRHVWRNAS